MDALLPIFLAVALAEQGDRMQLLAASATTRFGRAFPVAAGLILAAAANAAIAAVAGVLLDPLIPFRARTLLVAVALLSTGTGALFMARRPTVIAYSRLGAFGGPAFAGLVLGFGGAAQFLTFALAARAGSVGLAIIGATLGAAAAIVPAVAGGAVLAKAMRPVRLGVAVLFLIVGTIVMLAALRLI